MEREPILVGEVLGSEPSQLGHVVGRFRRTGQDAGRPVQVEGRRGVRLVRVAIQPDTHELERLALETGLLHELAAKRIEWMLALLEKASGQVPTPLERLVPTTRQQDAAMLVDAEGACCRLRTRVVHGAARRASRTIVIALDPAAAPRADAPAFEFTHAAQR